MLILAALATLVACGPSGCDEVDRLADGCSADAECVELSDTYDLVVFEDNLAEAEKPAERCAAWWQRQLDHDMQSHNKVPVCDEGTCTLVEPPVSRDTGT